MASRLGQLLGRLQLHSAFSSLSSLSSLPGGSASRSLSTTSSLARSIRDNHRQGTEIEGAKREVMEGLAGAKNVRLTQSHLVSRLPTAATLTELFDGILYTELPTVYIKATKNNTLINVMNAKNEVITYTSCRLEGFKHARKKTTIAGQTTGVAAGLRLLRRGIRTVRVEVKGLGPGRLSAVKGLVVGGVKVVSITDHTPLCELGPRPRKIRRI